VRWLDARLPRCSFGVPVRHLHPVRAGSPPGRNGLHAHLLWRAVPGSAGEQSLFFGEEMPPHKALGPTATSTPVPPEGHRDDVRTVQAERRSRNDIQQESATLKTTPPEDELTLNNTVA
jgi:hypothetical protein